MARFPHSFTGESWRECSQQSQAKRVEDLFKTKDSNLSKVSVTKLREKATKLLNKSWTTSPNMIGC